MDHAQDFERQLSRMYALIVLISMEDGVSHEASIECADSDAVCEKLKELMHGDVQWKAVTLVHIEDFPRMMMGAVPE